MDPKEPVVIVWPNGMVRAGKGYTVGDALRALELAREVVLAVPLGPPGDPEPQTPERAPA
jgi:hypothetical protein